MPRYSSLMMRGRDVDGDAGVDANANANVTKFRGWSYDRFATGSRRKGMTGDAACLVPALPACLLVSPCSVVSVCSSPSSFVLPPPWSRAAPGCMTER